jgi:hypothetical protein
MNRVKIPAWAIDLGKSRSGLCALTPEKAALIVVDLHHACSTLGRGNSGT